MVGKTSKSKTMVGQKAAVKRVGTKSASINARVEWRTSSITSSLHELDDALDRICREVSPEMPQAVNIIRRNGDCLSIVLGAKEGSILSYVAASSDPPYFVSLGNPTAKGVFTFFVALDHHSELLARHIISEREARKALREFVVQESGLPKNITWTEI